MTVGAKTKGWKPVGKIKKGKLRMEEEIQRHVQKSIEEKKKKEIHRRNFLLCERWSTVLNAAQSSRNTRIAKWPLNLAMWNP